MVFKVTHALINVGHQLQTLEASHGPDGSLREHVWNIFWIALFPDEALRGSQIACVCHEEAIDNVVEVFYPLRVTASGVT